MHDIELTEEQRMIRDMARDFARSEVGPHAQGWEQAGWIDDAGNVRPAYPILGTRDLFTRIYTLSHGEVKSFCHRH